jgi:hypothetical protein
MIDESSFAILQAPHFKERYFCAFFKIALPGCLLPARKSLNSPHLKDVIAIKSL